MGYVFEVSAAVRLTECFYQTVAKNGSLEVEYQVIAGAGLDVGFTLISPSGYRLVSEFRTSDGIHTVEPTEDGDYRLCFDNSFSKLSEKMVFFEVIVEGQAGDEEWADMAEQESMMEYKLEDIREAMDSVHKHLERSRQFQTLLRGFEARDRYLLEDNLWRVSFWSSVSLLIIMTVAATQVYTLRCFFDDKKGSFKP
ncbi:transmembrane emp24 domain-containing protein 1a isoform X2 [Esox lucius]|uniref:transmembrane emp24 domain-containing protein 1a isoform X2 n=1 Tax=Esox lucius TaxID=8010 RepID=UPI001476C497|nr:transmembrane emp24 domain-containing protein 1a isoform X2 [Esox lucius]